ncbi:MAG: DUF5320 domain-containing protein [candidate division WOR-3 bacterium]
MFGFGYREKLHRSYKWESAENPVFHEKSMWGSGRGCLCRSGRMHGIRWWNHRWALENKDLTGESIKAEIDYLNKEKERIEKRIEELGAL